MAKMSRRVCGAVDGFSGAPAIDLDGGFPETNYCFLRLWPIPKIPATMARKKEAIRSSLPSLKK
jgi:hypothetical protein